MCDYLLKLQALATLVHARLVLGSVSIFHLLQMRCCYELMTELALSSFLKFDQLPRSTCLSFDLSLLFWLFSFKILVFEECSLQKNQPLLLELLQSLLSFFILKLSYLTLLHLHLYSQALIRCILSKLLPFTLQASCDLLSSLEQGVSWSLLIDSETTSRTLSFASCPSLALPQ